MITAEEFFKELNRIVATRPKVPTQVLHSEGVEWGQNDYYCKNLYWAFDSVKSQNGSYVYDAISCVNSTDIDYCFESEICYESVDAAKCYDCDYIEDCANMRNSSFSVRCNNCHDVFGCVALKNKQFCIFNRQLTETEYKQKVEEYKKWPPEKVLAIVADLESKHPITQTNSLYNENSDYGNYVYYSKHCYLCFDAANSENGGYLYSSNDLKNCYDATYSLENQLCYEITDSGNMFNSDYIVWSANITDSQYVLDCANLKNSMGCSGLSNGQYLFLNRQLSKEDFERISKETLEDIRKKNLGWGNLKYYQD